MELFRKLTLAHLFARVLLRPWLYVPALRAAWRFRARGWYRRAPFLPLPPSEYVAWRLDTAYGTSGLLPTRAELTRYLRWTERLRRGGRFREVDVW